MMLFTTTEFPDRAFRYVRKFRPLVRLIGETVDFAVVFATEAAKYQAETGVLGQKGSFGGGGWDPQNIDLEMDQLYTGRF